jgi:Ni,Fe-hydrogenase I large subunit
MDEGKLRLEVRWDGSHIVAVTVASTRTTAATVLAGKPLAEVAQRLPQLFPQCPEAQIAASAAAIEAALGQAPDQRLHHRRAQTVALEAAVDHLGRLLQSWPEILSQPVRRDVLLAWHKRLASTDSLSIAAELGPSLLAWTKTLSTPRFEESPVPASAPLLPYFDAATLAYALHDVGDDFAARPTWQGVAGEVGPLARHALHPEVAPLLSEGRRIAARHAARRVDLSDLARSLAVPERLPTRIDTVRIGDDSGLARVDTARGLMIHRVTVRDGIATDYLIVAPTEWNFHPEGPFVRELVGRAAASRDEVERIVRLLALALDPCAEYDVLVRDAATE